MITLVSVDRIDAVWPHVREWLQRATMRTGGALTTGELWQGCRRGDIFMLVAHDGETLQGVSLWRPEDWQTGRKLHCLGAGGRDMLTWLTDMRKAVRALAVDCGAASIVSGGRDGWGRIFPKAKRLWVLYEEPI